MEGMNARKKNSQKSNLLSVYFSLVFRKAVFTTKCFKDSRVHEEMCKVVVDITSNLFLDKFN